MSLDPGLQPMNRHLLVEKIEENIKEEEEDSLVLVPDDYKIDNQYGLYKILKCAKDCEKFNEDFISRRVIVENSMVQNIPLWGKTYYLILENYVYGIY